MLTDAQIILETEKNLEQFYAFWAANSGGRIWHSNEVYCVSGIDGGWPVFAILPAALKCDEKQLARELAAGIRAGFLPDSLVVTIRSSGDPLLQALDAEGFKPFNSWWGMARSTENLPALSDLPALEAEQVNTLIQAQDFTDIINTEILKAPALQPGLIIGQEQKRFVAYTGYSGKQLCAASSTFIHGETAGLYFIATKPAFQRKGFGRSLTLQVMHHAVLKGCTLLVLHASRAGKHLYEQLGFKEYCRHIICRLSD